MTHLISVLAKLCCSKEKQLVWLYPLTAIHAPSPYSLLSSWDLVLLFAPGPWECQKNQLPFSNISHDLVHTSDIWVPSKLKGAYFGLHNEPLQQVYANDALGLSDYDKLWFMGWATSYVQTDLWPNTFHTCPHIHQYQFSLLCACVGRHEIA